MARWRKKFFVVMSRNARSATEFFGIPPNRVVELGRAGGILELVLGAQVLENHQVLSASNQHQQRAASIAIPERPRARALERATDFADPMSMLAQAPVRSRRGNAPMSGRVMIFGVMKFGMMKLSPPMIVIERLRRGRSLEPTGLDLHVAILAVVVDPQIDVVAGLDARDLALEAIDVRRAACK